MYEITNDNVEHLKISTRLIAKDLLSRGFQIIGFFSTSGLLQVDVPDVRVPMRIFSVINESMSFISGRTIAGNKQVTNALVSSLGVKVPAELYIPGSKLAELRYDIEAFISRHEKIVAKPIDGAHGKSVFLSLKSYDQVCEVADEILLTSRFGGFIIQEQLTGFDVRVVCVGGKYESAMTRVPASVIGDGVHTVQQLIEQENLRAERSGENYNTLYNKIDLKYVSQYLADEDLLSVPDAGKSCQVIGIANVGVGGTRKNLDEALPDFMIEQAEMIARELRLPVCGVDFFVDKVPEKTDTPARLNPVAIEVNHCPGITMYESFDDPRQKHLVTRIVDMQLAAHRNMYATDVS